jgi:nicotinamide phosphoribosyltransferase
MTKLIYDCDVDSYKLSHYMQYPDDITNVSSYIEARAGLPELVFCGLSGWLKSAIDGKVYAHDVEVLRSYVESHGLPFNTQFNCMVGKHLPLQIEALPEGTIVSPGTCMVQVTNTDPAYAWLTSFVETSLLRAIWYSTTVATNSREIKKVIKHYLEKTGDPAGLPFKLHDFGFRGVSSYESGCIGGFAHLVNFMGTDTMGALKYCREYYHEPMAGFSIPAAEHSTMTSWGRDREVAAYANMVDKFSRPGSIYAVVSDSYDIYNACSEIWGEELRQEVIDRGGTLVVRPDSGDPLVVVLKVLEILGEKFGTTLNAKGYKVLPPYLRVIQGDGVNIRSISAILGKMAVNGWSADNIAFGMGGALLQAVTRDDFSFAMKASAISRNNGMSWEGFSKNPVTQSGKRSKAGRLAVLRDAEGKLFTTSDTNVLDRENVLQKHWVNGDLLIDPTLKEIRERADVG